MIVTDGESAMSIAVENIMPVMETSYLLELHFNRFGSVAEEETCLCLQIQRQRKAAV